ncbi:MAG: phosphonate metabolism protein/1,5-bisphosphokinase (PRPP-forming) PhnN [Gammaproteobacteria bacterium]|nr:phosphonate metabolism protein/1,5-bisphosphokinase (PRPP-forming) PhnN [Gammaproteobacteria bacterium]
MAKLFYVIGASGAGKDSLIQYARSNIAHEAQVVFTHRYITRPADAGGENHVALEEKEFIARENMNCFAMSWHSHETYYGIGIEINQWLAKGLNVVVNGSRAYLPQALNKYPELCPVLIHVDTEVLRLRLIQRGRENKQQIEHRLMQAQILQKTVVHPGLISIENNGALSDAGSRLLKIVQNIKNKQCA